MFIITNHWLRNLTEREWSNLIRILCDSAYFNHRHWAIVFDFKIHEYFFQSHHGITKELITKFLNQITNIDDETILISNLIKLIFRKSKHYQPANDNPNEETEIDFLTFNPQCPGGRLPIATETDLILTEEDIKEQDIEMMKKKGSIINDGKAISLLNLLSQQRIKYQQELAQKDQTIANMENAHEAFLDAQLYFYQQAKPDTFSQFEASNPPALEIGHFLNFLESQWQNKEQESKSLAKQNQALKILAKHRQEQLSQEKYALITLAKKKIKTKKEATELLNNLQTKWERENENYKVENGELEAKIDDLKSQLKTQSNRLKESKSLSKQNKELTIKLQTKQSMLNHQDKLLADINHSIDELDTKLEQANSLITERNKEIIRLNEDLNLAERYLWEYEKNNSSSKVAFAKKYWKEALGVGTLSLFAYLIIKE